ncbi:hypothetical protein N7516_010650, partial [Penicillium verrucosum]|uniref:uncharacterized protein n=1 Tax=Penicillium verrucosum TaxID=60171 RepID=UPI002545192B
PVAWRHPLLHSPTRRTRGPGNFDAASRAWRYFVRDQWVGGDATHGDQQKRALIKRWAIADQQFHDSYQSRAPEDEPILKIPNLQFTGNDVQNFCMVYFYTTELTGKKEALLAKCILGLFPWEQGWEFLAEAGEMIMFLPLEDNQEDIPETFKFHQSLARPNFLDMHMALDGTVFFRDCYVKPIIDDRTIETGLGLWVEFATNEEFAHFYCEVGPGNQVPIEQALNYIQSRVIYQDCDEDADADPREILEDEPVDMRRPLVEIYRGGEVDLVDDYVPGFREAEEQGNGLAIGYDLEQILANDKIMEVIIS